MTMGAGKVDDVGVVLEESSFRFLGLIVCVGDSAVLIGEATGDSEPKS